MTKFPDTVKDPDTYIQILDLIRIGSGNRYFRITGNFSGTAILSLYFYKYL